jgi:hypothetical protein
MTLAPSPADKQVGEVRRRRILHSTSFRYGYTPRLRLVLNPPLLPATMSAPLGVIDSQVIKQITDLCAAFHRRFIMQPPEFSHPRHWYAFKDIYDDYSAGIRASSWFQGLTTSAHSLDLAGLNSLADPEGDGYQFCMIRCLQFALLETALRRDRAYLSVSPAIPRFFREAGWDVPADWNCEIKAAASPPLRVQAANEEFLARQDAAITASQAQLHPCRSCATYFRLSESADGDHCSADCSADCPPYSAVPPGLEQPRPATAAQWMAFNGTRAPTPPPSPPLALLQATATDPPSLTGSV